MAFEIPGHPKAPVVAAADLSTKKYRFVKHGAGVGQGASVNVCSAATDCPSGVLQEGTTGVAISVGQGLDVMVFGLTKVILGGTVAAGDRLGTDANGAAVKLTEGTDTTKYIAGRAEMAGVSGDIITAFINCINPHRAA